MLIFVKIIGKDEVWVESMLKKHVVLSTLR